MSYALYIFDLDGTLFRGNEPIPGAVDCVQRVRSAGSKVRFLTNNSGQTLETYLNKLRGMGFEAEPKEIYSSAIGVAACLTAMQVRRAFVVGEPGLKLTLQDAGIEVVEEGAEAVVVGICRTFSYELMSAAMKEIRAGARFIASNTDPTYPVEGGQFIPGAGSIVAAVQTCAENAPFVVGKPNPYLVELILRDAGLNPTDALVIGDRMDTDVEAGKRAGCETLLVMTGAALDAPEGQSWLPSVADLVPASRQFR